MGVGGGHRGGRFFGDEVSNLYKQEGGGGEILEFYKNPKEQIIWSDFVISRAGALSLSEIISLNRGTGMIPLPTSVDNHQVEKAKYIESENMGIMHQEKHG
jgi:UDP-N-acetylglucosamine:LPS N-acetylglucosamine transferase